MTSDPQVKSDDRRKDVRLAADGQLDLAVIDRYGQATEVLRDIQIINISAGGMELISAVPVKLQSWLRMDIQGKTDDINKPTIKLEVVDTSMTSDNQYRVHCRVIEGKIPAKFLYNW